MVELLQKRKELGLTQIQAAKICGVSRRTYQSYEERAILNATYDELLRKLEEAGLAESENHVLSLKTIKNTCRQVLPFYPEVACAYLFGSYARGEATGKSDIDILVVCPPIGMKFFEIGPVLEETLGKTVDIHTHRQLAGNPALLEEILKDGIKIYGRQITVKD